MPITSSLNSKANVKQFTNQDIPSSTQQPVIASYYATSSTAQTVINLSFSVFATGSNANTDIFWLFVDGKKLDLGSSNDYTFTAIGADGSSAQVTLTQPLSAGLNIQAFKLGLKKDSEFQTDNRFVQLYAAQNAGFQNFISQTDFLMTATTNIGAPVSGTFYSTVVGRAPMADLSQDLRPRMGIERFQIQNFFALQNEFGPNGEPVYGVSNDTFGQIRFVGPNWQQNFQAGIPSDGPGVTSQGSLTTNYVEFTFYGTGLNLLTTRSGGRSGFWSVDGGSETTLSSPNFDGNASSPIGTRGNNVNTVCPIVAGLALGVHTVKIRDNASNFVTCGYEVLNESSTIKVPPGIGYAQGQKSISSSLASFGYAVVATGTKGGRTVVYQNGNGTIGQSWQATNASQLTLTSADHTNEEVARTYFWREFGVGRSDDFSGNFSAGSSLSFTLDDGITTLVGSGVSLSNEVLYLNGNTNYILFTFIGTGLDIIEKDIGSGSVDTFTYAIDNGGAASIPFTFNGNTNTRKIVSGLPYGTHVVRITRTSATSASIGFQKFVVYQPKKPAVPTGTVELADYNVSANFVANSTANLDSIATGVLRKQLSIREAFYSGTWTLVSLNAGAINFFPISTTTNGDYFQYTFFGTGFDFRFFASTVTSSVTVSLRQSGGSLLTLNSTNFPGLTTGSYGPTTGFTYSTGILSQQAGSNTPGSGMYISGLALGVYTVRFTNGASSTLSLNTLDIIAPTYSYKSNLYSDLQNTLTVGSNSLSDNRNATPVKDSLPAVKAWAQAAGVTSSPTTTSTSFVPVPDMFCTIKTNGGALRISYSMSNFSTGASPGIAGYTRIYVDGVAILNERQALFCSSGDSSISDTLIFPVSPGTHTVQLFWFTTSGTMTNEALRRGMTVEEK